MKSSELEFLTHINPEYAKKVVAANIERAELEQRLRELDEVRVPYWAYVLSQLGHGVDFPVEYNATIREIHVWITPCLCCGQKSWGNAAVAGWFLLMDFLRQEKWKLTIHHDPYDDVHKAKFFDRWNQFPGVEGILEFVPNQARS